MKTNYKRTKYACFYAYLAMSSVFCLPSMLFVTFRELYGISYTLSGTLVLINFCTQLTIDLVFTFFAKHFNIHKTVKIMPLLTALGLAIYSLIPGIAPQFAYAGLVLGTVIFSVASGLCEVLLSPMVAALPSENPDRDMSMLHSLYAYGVLMVVVVSSVYLKIFGTKNWMYLTLFWAALPLISSVWFSLSPMPDMNLSHGNENSSSKGKHTMLALCAVCIFLGSGAENAITNWISGYMEKALALPKMFGDIAGLSVFAVLLGLTRTWYAKYGKNISLVLLIGMIGAVICYLIAGLSDNVILCMIACVLLGIFTSMLWPGSLMLMEEKVPNAGVAAFALMAAGGDLGGSVAPQLVGLVADTVTASSLGISLAGKLSMTAEQVGMKAGILSAIIFPIIGVFLLIYIIKRKNDV